jgi:hypothetical protein
MSSNSVEYNKQYIHSIIIDNYQKNQFFAIKLNDYTSLGI